MADMNEVSPWAWQDQFGFSQAISVHGSTAPAVLCGANVRWC